MDIVNEKTSSVVTLTFRSELGTPITPSSVTYKINDLMTGAELLENVTFVPPDNTYDIIITPEINQIVNRDKDFESKVVTLQWTYSLDGLTQKYGTAEYMYQVKNLAFLG